MSKEVNYPSAESLTLENSARIDELASYFQNGLDSVLNGEKQEATLFEGDFILARNKNGIYQIGIGEGKASDPSVLFTRFMREIGKIGNIVLARPTKPGIQFLDGETPASLYFREKFPHVPFPVDRTDYWLKTKANSNLLIYAQKFYFADALRTPLTLRWVTENDNMVDLYDSPTKERVPTLI